MSPGKLQSASNDGNSAEPASMIEDNVIDAMWSVFVAPVGTFSAAQRRGALLLIGFAANVKPAIISKNITHVIQHGLPSASVPIEQVDLPLSRAACLALQKLFLPSASASTVSASIPVDELSASLSRLILSDSCQAAWFGTVEQAVGTLFLMHENPEQIAVSLLQNATQNWLIKAGAATDKLAPTNLSKLFFLTGQVAIKMLVFIEQSESRVKGLRSLREKASETQAESAEATIVPSDDDDGDSSEDDAPRGKSKGKQTKAKAAKKPSKSKKASESASAPPADLQTDMGLAGTEEYELEVLREQAEHSLLAATSILGKLLPLTVQVLKSPSKFPSSSLQRSAVLCLSKCMTVHAEFCETYLPVLFTLLEKSTDASLRANIMIALGDMAFRFPNLIDPWTSKMYAPLREKQQPRVRKNTLMVLTHLILNDMIKVKGEISEMAVCIEDEDTRIADLAKLFFHELAKKGKNPVYNILSDTMSRLSSSPNVSPTLFQSVLRFLLQFIDKEKQTESLVEKLCQRLLAASDVKGMRDFAYCLSQLTFSSEKCVKKIMDIECLKCYKDRLFDQDVFSFFGSIARQMKKTVAKSGQELRDQVDEWEKNLESWHLEQAHDANTATRASNVARSGDGIESAAPSDAPIKILVPTVAPRRVVRNVFDAISITSLYRISNYIVNIREMLVTLALENPRSHQKQRKRPKSPKRKLNLAKPTLQMARTMTKMFRTTLRRKSCLPRARFQVAELVETTTSEYFQHIVCLILFMNESSKSGQRE
jgi:condensin complex subunit 1